jgi:hypothetical protein
MSTMSLPDDSDLFDETPSPVVTGATLGPRTGDFDAHAVYGETAVRHTDTIS